MAKITPLYVIYRFLTKRGACKYCGQPVLWVTTDQSKKLPLNGDSTPMGPPEPHPVNGIMCEAYLPSSLHLRWCTARKRKAS